MQRPSLYFNVQGDSPSLREAVEGPYHNGPPDGGNRQARVGPTLVLYMLGTSQLHLDVVASTCRRVPLVASECPFAVVSGLLAAVRKKCKLHTYSHPFSVLLACKSPLGYSSKVLVSPHYNGV